MLYAVNHEDGAREVLGDALFDAVDGEVRYVLDGDILLAHEALDYLCDEAGFCVNDAAAYLCSLAQDYVAHEGAWAGAEWLSLSVPLIAMHGGNEMGEEDAVIARITGLAGSLHVEERAKEVHLHDMQVDAGLRLAESVRLSAFSF